MSVVNEYRERIISGPLLRTILWLAWPPIVASLVNISYNFIDTLWLSRLGAAEMASPRQAWFILMVIYAVGMGLTAGNTALISQYVGAGDFRRASECARQLLIFALSVGLGFFAFLYVMAPHLLKLLGTPKEIYGFAVNYMRVVSLGVPLGFAAFALVTIFHAFGDTRTPTMVSIASTILNAILDPIFIFGLLGLPALGVVGAAIATVISRSLIALVITPLLIRGYKGIKISLRGYRFDASWFKRTVRIGGPIMVQQVTNAFAFTLLLALVNVFGVVAAAAYTIGMTVINLIEAVLRGFSQATSIIIGQNLGANSHGRAYKAAKLSMAVVGVVLGLGALLLLIFKDPLIAIFIKEPATHEEAILLMNVFQETRKLLDLFAISVPFFGVFFISMAVARGSGHTFTVMILSILRLWAIRLGLSYLLAIVLLWGTTGIWLAMSLSNLFAGLAGALWVVRGSWLRRVI